MRLSLKCKLAGSEDLRRRTLSIANGFGISDLRTVVSELFQLANGAPFTLLWRDEDEDLCTVDSDLDVAEAIRCCSMDARPILRLEMRVETAKSNCTAAAAFDKASLQELAKHLPSQIIAQLQPLACELEKYAPGFQAHAMNMARQFKLSAQELHKHMPAEFHHKADGLCNFLKKAKKGKELHMKFVADTSLPDGTEVYPGQLMSKSWKVVNSGQDTWPCKARLQHVGSDLFEGARPSDVPCLAPGQETELSLNNMTTPSEPGRYISHWRLATAEGKKFGDRLWFEVTVVNADGSQAAAVVHLNVVCDVTGMTPIVGNRFKKFGFDYDLCQEAFDQLSESEKHEFRLIATPEDAAAVHAEEAEYAARELEAVSAVVVPAFVHEGIWCDACTAHPITGNRYWKQLQADSFDLCQGCYEQLAEDKKAELTLKPAALLEELAQDNLVVDPVEVAAESGENRMFDMSDLTASCMLDIEATFKQLSNEERRFAEEAACLIAEAKAEKARLEAEAEKARLEAEAEKARMEAEAKVIEVSREIPLEWQGIVDSLINMGFSAQLAQDVTMEHQGNFEAALEAALASPPPAYVPPPPAPAVEALVSDWEQGWDYLLEELVEMGFNDMETNKKLVAAHKGDLKSTVTALVSEERAKR